MQTIKTVNPATEQPLKTYSIPLEQIQKPQIGVRSSNLPRKYAMYLAQQVGYQLQEIAQTFGVNHTGSVSHALTDVRQRLLRDVKLKNQLAKVRESLW
jgi:chromosomal replication initiation ATPase DnaA